MTPRDFGTANYPLRVSSLPMVLKCPARVAMQMIEAPERSSSPAADTGSMAHFAISLYHTGKGADDAVKEMKAAKSLHFPLADEDEAEKFFRSYARDPRNAPEAVENAELQIRFSLPPHPLDPTGEPIWFQGTTDQVRRASEETVEVWDYKTGKDEGVVLLHEHLLQLAGYSRGVENTLGQRVVDSGIIRARGYHRRGVDPPEAQPHGVFFHSCLDSVQIDTLLFRVRAIVAGVRRGEPLFGPGPYCNHCPYEGTSVCIPKGISLGLRV